MSFISFHSRDYAERERLDAAREFYAAVANVELALPRHETPEIAARIRLLPGISIASIECSSLIAQRELSSLADGNDDISLLLNPAGNGGWTSSQPSLGEVTCAPGEACLGFNEQPGRVAFHGQRTRFLSLGFSRQLLAPMLNQDMRPAVSKLFRYEPLERLARLALDLATPEPVALDGGGKATNQPTWDPAAVAEEMFDLAALCLGASPDAAQRARGRGLREARLRAIKGDMRAHAGCGDLTLPEVARRHGVSPGYLRALFRQEQTTFTDYLLELRLQLAWQRLTDPRHAHRTVSEIAFSAGFNNLSWFYRAFKHHFGMKPTEARGELLVSADTNGREVAVRM
ncbi:AraC family transcriptional regulator [Billgrantia kenyensis]|uniref:Helix-turn-helix transcriptional regulator n=1 Tax=Billgrantia kenyensis TaxID=321266 RepID=A0A7W0ACK3_9GAMM|nr:AraC family transcriptional regulator [Halomonas kenyensis]MBA2777281.1 helix-turn-helix transcriptional regulator [Halomonas kenyensis]MCG6659951.1 helix-turn-helix transcriptional regulator [Halomonas kenyensis]